jgi:hypothetical protein
MLRIAASAWETNGTKQVVYRGADGHIHELFVSVGGSWSHADLTRLADAPQPASDTAFAGYEWKAGGSKQVVYITADGHIHELFVSVGGSWSHADLTQVAGAPLILNQVSFAGFEWKAGGTKQVVYPTPAGHLHELFVSVGGSWSHADLTQMAGAPSENNVFPVIAVCEWKAGGTKQVVYRGADGHIHELFVSVGGSWSHADLTQMTGAPQPEFASGFASYQWEAGGSKQVAYITADGHIHELFVSVGGSWSHADLTEMTGAPRPQPDTAFAGYEWKAGGTKQVIYRTEDGHIHELFVAVQDSWDHADLTLTTDAPPASTNAPIIAGYEWGAGNTKQVVFLTPNGHIHELFVSVGDSWSHADLTQITGAPIVA